MLVKLHYRLIGIVALLLFGCTEYADSPADFKTTICDTITNQSDLYGTWINTVNARDTIQISEGLINRWDEIGGGFFHFYKYQISSDMILIKYTGLYKVGTVPYYGKIYINHSKDSVLILGFQSVYPSVAGDTFAKK
jgi:hypothetical protein